MRDCENCKNHTSKGCTKWECEFEPTTKNDLALIHTEGLDEEIRCTMCTNYMKSDRGCDGSCVVDKDMYKAVMDAIEKRIQPTTNNDSSSGTLKNSQKLEKPTTYGILALLEKTYADFCNSEGGEGWLKIDGKEYPTDAGYAIEGVDIFMEIFKRRLAESENKE